MHCSPPWPPDARVITLTSDWTSDQALSYTSHFNGHSKLPSRTANRYLELVTNPSMDSERQAAHPTSNIATSNVTTLGAEIAVTNTTQSKAHQTVRQAMPSA